ncbi:hypothetical protein SU60_19775 [Vibrio mytili]|uniref:Uncharacterized protein n=1 Tax=Vibrio mytili TaxID=50718 RepID=A0A0C3DD56_9VIBR|nr:hypothetical protein SU60_19775 [Vibrio mytili]
MKSIGIPVNGFHWLHVYCYINNITIEVLIMTLNKYFVFVPVALETEIKKETEVSSNKEAQRQTLLKQAQQQGGL